MKRQILRLVEERCAVTFLNNRMFEFHLADNETDKTVIDLFEEGPELYLGTRMS